MSVNYNAGVDFIDKLLVKYRISLRTVYRFAEEHDSEIQGIEGIFDLKTERDKKLCLVLFRLLSGRSEEIGSHFSNRYGFADSLDDLFYEQNKLLLITAFMYNPPFFAMAWNLCGLVLADIADKSTGRENEGPVGGTKIIVFPQALKVHRLAASGTEEGLRQFGKSHHVSVGDYSGELQIMSDAEGYLQFRFKLDRESDAAALLLVEIMAIDPLSLKRTEGQIKKLKQPVQFKVSFTVDANGEEREVVLDKEAPNNNDLVFSSVIGPIDITKGVSITRMELV
jgi:hypothetical protein